MAEPLDDAGLARLRHAVAEGCPLSAAAAAAALARLDAAEAERDRLAKMVQGLGDRVVAQRRADAALARARADAEEEAGCLVIADALREAAAAVEAQGDDDDAR